jgi:hypothetical protein
MDTPVHGQASYVGPDKKRHTAPDTFADKIDAEYWLAGERQRINVRRLTGAAWLSHQKTKLR